MVGVDLNQSLIIPMTRIRVNPANLRQAARQLSGIADRLRALGSEAHQAVFRAPSYDGQFGPRARAMGMEAEARLRTQADRFSALSEELEARAAAFEAVDQETLTAFDRLTQLLQGWIEEAKPILSPYVQIALFPWQKVEQHLRFGYLIDEPVGENGEGEDEDDEEEDEWSPPWWTPIIMGTENAWSAFDARVGQPIRDFLLGSTDDEESDPEGMSIDVPVATQTPTLSQTASPTPAPVPIAPIPERTPTAEEMQKRYEARVEAERIKFQRAEAEYLETEPLEYIRYRVYWDNGIDYVQMVENKQDNILSMDIINDNSRYPGSGRIILVMNSVDEQNMQFIVRIDMDEQHLPNYEPVFFEELKRQYPQDYEHALENVDQERFKEVNILTDYFEEAFDGEYWEEFWEAFLAPAYE